MLLLSAILHCRMVQDWILEMVRAGGDTYLIYLTALDQEIDIVNGYDTGQMIILPNHFH